MNTRKVYLSRLDLLLKIRDGKQPNKVYLKYGECFDNILYYTWNKTCKCYATPDGEIMAVQADRDSLMRPDTLYYEQDILNEEERDYLRNLIKPFRDNVTSIRKETAGGTNRISIIYGYYYDELEDISNLITNMAFKGAMCEEMERVIKYSTILIDSKKDKRDCSKFEIDYGIAHLKEKYRGEPTYPWHSTVKLPPVSIYSKSMYKGMEEGVDYTIEDLGL